MRGHEFPKPLWNDTNGPILFTEELAAALGVKICEAGEIIYAPNHRYLDQIMQIRVNNQVAFTAKPVMGEFPTAVHGPDGQSMKIMDKHSLKQALAAGWSRKPVVAEEAPYQAPMSPSTPPRPAKDKVTA